MSLFLSFDGTMAQLTPKPNPAPDADFHSIGSVLRIGERWTVRPGVSHGLRQPGLRGLIMVRDVDKCQLDEVCFFLSQFLTPAVTSGLPASKTRLDLVNCFLQTVVGLQQELGLAMDTHTHVATVHQPNVVDGWVRFEVMMPAPHYRITRHVIRWLVRQPWSLNTSRDELNRVKKALAMDLQSQRSKSINNESIRSAALQLGIPCFNLTSGIMVLGMGQQSKWLQSTQSHTTSAIGVQIAHSKKLTAHVLKACGLPGATHESVRSAEEAEMAATKLGFPVVVKPENLERGVGVSADLRNPSAVRRAFDIAHQHSDRILVERHCPGFTHRISVFNRKIVRVSKRIAGGVVGDGHSSIRALLGAEQSKFQSSRLQRSRAHDLLVLDDEALDLLHQDQLTPDHILEKGRYVRLRRRDNINAGGRNELVPIERVHPDNLELSITVADLLGLDFAGIDLIVHDISISWRDSPSLVCEVNSMPQLGVGSDPEAYMHILKDFFPQGWSIPAQLIIVPDHEEARIHVRQQLLKPDAGHGVSDISGLWVSGKPVTQCFLNGFAAAQALLLRPDVSHIHCLMSPKEIMQHGTPLFAWDAITVADKAFFTPAEKSILAKVIQTLHHHKDNPKVNIENAHQPS